jgi:hypothetical protein
MERNTSQSATKLFDARIADGFAALWPSAGSEAYVGVPAMNASMNQEEPPCSIQN